MISPLPTYPIVPSRENSAATPVRLFTELWEHRCQLHLKRAQEGEIDVLLIGDSITQYWSDERYGARIWEAEILPLKAANFGIAGNRTQHILWRLQNGEAEGFSPRVVALLVGTNNISFEDDNITPRNKVEEVVEAIGLIVAEARARFPHAHILLTALLPRGAADSVLRQRANEVNADIQAFGNDQEVHYIDIGEHFLDSDGEIPAEVMPDALHPNEKGYSIYANAIKPKLLELLSLPPVGPLEDLPGVSQIIVPATAQYPRNSEGDLVALEGGRLLYAWGRKIDGDDISEGCIVGVYSDDGGKTWTTEAEIIQPIWDGIADVMCVSFCRSPRGLHLFFLGRIANPHSGSLYNGCNQVFQMISSDEGQSWSAPVAISHRFAYTILNNARVIRTSSGRLLAPIASVPGSIFEFYDEQRVYCLYSDDNGQTWRESNELAITGTGLMEPGVAECSDGSLYMTIRTKSGYLYEARSLSDGALWHDLKRSNLRSAEAPATVLRAPHTGDLWMLWCNTPYTGKWYDRHDIALAISKDNGRTWGPSRTLEHRPDYSFGYISAMFYQEALWLTYYEWPLEKEAGQIRAFHMTSSRLRKIPIRELEQS